jgi:hypothetical protein
VHEQPEDAPLLSSILRWMSPPPPPASSPAVVLFASTSSAAAPPPASTAGPVGAPSALPAADAGATPHDTPVVSALLNQWMDDLLTSTEHAVSTVADAIREGVSDTADSLRVGIVETEFYKQNVRPGPRLPTHLPRRSNTTLRHPSSH